LLGCGGWMNGRYFHSSFPNFLLDQNLNINRYLSKPIQ
jgi:hypothetical protein